jgi:hypothetical protein
MVRRLLEALDKKLTLLETRMAPDGGIDASGQSGVGTLETFLIKRGMEWLEIARSNNG